jgi:tetratricopeptide (TPR) repeat protein
VRGAFLTLFGFLLLSSTTQTQVRAATLAPCPANYEFGEAMDYLDPKFQDHIRGIERNHLNSDVENLIKGQSTAHPGGDLRFIVNNVPNHHRALALLMSLAIRDATETPAESGPYTVRCWMHRATVFSPQDGSSFLLYGVYLARNGLRREAIAELEQALKLLPDSSEVNYNLGLVYFDLKDYKTSQMYAQRAYALGFPLPGLRRKLETAGFPLD